MPLLTGALRHKLLKKVAPDWLVSFCTVQALPERYRRPVGQKQESRQRKSKKTAEPATT
jgi:hypothetical protein